MKTTQVNIKELKANHPEVYQKEHERYCQSQWELPLEDDFYIDSLNENNHWLDVDKIHYSISYSQGDDAFFTGRVYLEKFLDAFDTENEYFVLREALKIGDCDEYMVIREGVGYRSSARFDSIEWRGYDDGTLDEGAVLECDGPYKSILAGMNYIEYYQICLDQMDDLDTWVRGKCKAMFGRLYDQIRGDIDYQMSEEAFDEWAESLDEQSAVEEQLALMKLAGWQLEYQWYRGMDRWCVFTPDHAFLLADPDEQQAIRRAFGYFIQGLR